MQCPIDCWKCSSNAQGKGVCIENGQCTQEKVKVGQKGGGCACALDAEASRGGTAWTLALLGLCGMLAGRRRRR
jgi:MYXO-CTERM domain-containing protein